MKFTGLGGKVVNAFGLSRHGFCVGVWQPVHQPRSITTIKFVNANSPNSGDTIYNNDYNNFVLRWVLPGTCPGSSAGTILRAVYGINYTFAVDFLRSIRILATFLEPF